MILEDATYEAFGYYPSKLKLQSGKPILAVCELCGEIRISRKCHYHTFCNSCCHILSGEQKGKNHPMFGKHHTDKARALMSKNHADVKGENNPSYKYGKKIRKAKSQAKRKRDLGYTILIPLAEGEVGHHITDEYVIGIPKRVHEKFSGISRKNHRALIYEWLKVNDKQKYELYCLMTGGNV